MTTNLNHKPNTINMTDIARAAKVSRPTVSIVLNGRYNSARISEETRERVLQVAKDMGYRRNALAHAVKTGRSNTLGFLTTVADSEYSMLILSGILNEAAEQGYTVKRFQLNNNEKDVEVIERCSEERPDGVIVNDYGQGTKLEALFQEFESQSLPHVWLASQEIKQGIQLGPNDDEGVYGAIQHLIGLGHRKIAFIGGIENKGTSVLRYAGFLRAMRGAGLDESHVFWSRWETATVEEAATQFVRERGVTAFVTVSDALALLIILKMHRLGIGIPEEVSVIGYGNMARVPFSYPPLTTVTVPYREMGRASVKKLLALLQNPEATPEYEVIPFATPLVVRESTGPAPDRA